MKVYKAVCIKSINGYYLKRCSPNSRFVSVCGGSPSLTYEIGQETVPVVGRCFGFNSLENAKKFIRESGYGSAVLEGEATDVRKTFKMAKPFYKDSDKDPFKSFWTARKMKRKLCVKIVAAPQGTVTFSSFVPEKLVFETGME